MRLLHTGQHYDRRSRTGSSSGSNARLPDANLGVGSGSHAEQTAGVLAGVEADLGEHPADLVLVGGDVNSTMAAALAATKLNIAVGHVESGCDRATGRCPRRSTASSPTGSADLLLCTSADAVENLGGEGDHRRASSWSATR